MTRILEQTRPGRRPSIKRRLLLILLPATLLSWAVTGLFGYRIAYREAERLVDSQLAHSARILLTMTRHEYQERYPDPIVTVAELAESFFAQGQVPFAPALAIVDHGGDDQVLLHSPDAIPLLYGPLQEGFSDLVTNTECWRVFALNAADGTVSVRVGEPCAIRRQAAREVAGDLLRPLWFVLPLLAVAVWLAVLWGLASLKRLTREVEVRSAENLTPILDRAAPLETGPLTDALNTLLGRLDQTLYRERRFTADAAHELRTPLAGLKTQAQVALRAQDPAQRQRALVGLEQGVDNVTRLLNQLLTLARLEHGGEASDRAHVDLARLVDETVRDQDLDGASISVAHGNRTIPMTGSAEALRILLRNLIENALRYSPTEGSVEVRAEREDGHPCLTVTDNGPGIPRWERERVFDRFYRGSHHQGPGSGLGLAIVRNVADLHHARIDLEERREGGLAVRVCFPRHSPDWPADPAETHADPCR